MTVPTRALVLGGTGFIGLNLAAHLRDEGYAVQVARRRTSNTLFARALGLPLVTVDPGDADDLTRAFREVDVVFHAAAPYPRVSAGDDASASSIARACATLDPVLDALARAGGARLVFTSTSATIGPPAEHHVSAHDGDTWPAPPTDSHYHALKLALEAAVLAAAGRLDIVVVNPGACLGPWDWKPGVGQLVVAALHDALPPWSDGVVMAVDVRDVARGQRLVAEHGVAGQRYALAGHALSYAALLGAIAGLTGATLPTATPLAVTRAYADAEEARWLATRRGRPSLSRELVDLVAHGHPITSLRAAALGWAPGPLAAALSAAVHWYRTHGYAPVARAAASSRLHPG